MAEVMQNDHNLIMENRKRTVLTGVSEVVGFDDESVNMITCLGNLAVRGENLRIERFDKETGDLEIDGTVYALVYTTDRKSGGFFSKIFR